jgi:FkbM family methyltransferase
VDIKDIKSYVSELTPNNLLLNGWSSYSQYDEDGIIRECLKRIETIATLSKSFVEIGCGNGLENNTHQLLLDGYYGIWIDGSVDNIWYIAENLEGVFFDSLLVVNKRVDIKTSPMLASASKRFVGVSSIDFLSVDIDGFDRYICGDFIKQLNPKLVCVEYNAKFPPPTRLTIDYNPSHMWRNDDYYGSSLQAWVDYFNLLEYKLLCCNISGVNAFFIHKDFTSCFTLYSVDDLYQPARYNLTAELHQGIHPPTLKWLKQILTKNKSSIRSRSTEDSVVVANREYGDLLVYKKDFSFNTSTITTVSFQESKVAEVINFLKENYQFFPLLFIHIGANIGAHALYALHILGIEKAICIESKKKYFDLLLLNTAKNQLEDRIECSEVSLADYSAVGQTAIFDDSQSSNDTDELNSTTQLAGSTKDDYSLTPLYTLDNYFKQNNSDWRNAILWVNLDGYEGDIFSGGEDVFSSDARPGYIVTEFCPYVIERTSDFKKYFDFFIQCVEIYDITSVENKTFKKITADHLKEIYTDTKNKIDQHAYLLLLILK